MPKRARVEVGRRGTWAPGPVARSTHGQGGESGGEATPWLSNQKKKKKERLAGQARSGYRSNYDATVLLLYDEPP